MNLPFLPFPLPLAPLQRVLLVALLVPLLLVTVVAAVPALILLPFLPGGTDRTIRILRTHTAQIRTLLDTSRTAPAPRRRKVAGRR